MFANTIITLLGLLAVASSAGGGQTLQCNNSPNQCAPVKAQQSVGDATVGEKPVGSGPAAGNWSLFRARNKTMPRQNLSEIDELLLNSVRHKLGIQFSAGTNRQTAEDELEIGPDEAEFVTKLRETYFSSYSPFNPAYSKQVSPECAQAAEAYLSSLRSMKMWALRMYDAGGKLSSGLLNGNINQYGDYDQCLNVRGTGQHSTDDAGSLRGRYCLAGIQPTVVSSGMPFLRHLYDLVQSHGILTSELGDPGHRVPRFSTINWALCVPSACSAKDIQHSLTEFLQDASEGTGIQLDVSVEPELCEVKNSIWEQYYTPTTLKVWIGFLVYLAIVFLSTFYEYKWGNTNQWLSAFSLIQNTRAIFCVKDDPNDVPSVHGIRFLNAMLLVIAHKSMALFFNPYANRTDMSETLGQQWTVVGRAASLFTDPFIMFSGFLTTYSTVGRLLRGQQIKLYQDYIGRLLRIIPPLGALILFCTFVLPFLGSGPQWNLVVTNHGDICKEFWWRNMLFIHNYFGFKNMCLTHTHHIGIDTELFFVSPLFIWLIWKWPKKGAAALIILALISTVHRFYITYKLRLSNYVYFGTSVKQLFDTADNMYILPYYRLTVYLMGVMLGYACRRFKSISLTPNQLRLGWYASSFLLVLAFFGPAPMGSIDYVYDPLEAANYAAFSPIAWCLFFSWAVFTSHLGYRNKLTDVLSWRGFRVTTRISYAVYLTQFPIFFFNVGRVRTPLRYNFFTSVLLDFKEYGAIFLASYVLTVLFEIPFSNIRKLLFDNGRKRKPETAGLSGQKTCDINKNSNSSSSSSSSSSNNKTIVYPADQQTKDLRD
ncbi:O-acyltransferase like protein-like [Sabethes cyaneus]|uniref:O-acyltransferase like protein-like n=1 Tax=Sabethes cyaneus TaxID=53552 RepID=UPI00237E565D|nr:O-acyltransferase like protein-like [Sabethes cyaneus]